MKTTDDRIQKNPPNIVGFYLHKDIPSKFAEAVI